LVADEAPYGIEDLARLGGVTRRTIRYYIQEGLLPAPLGLGRGRHYGSEHLAQLQAVRALQERGLSLDEVRRELSMVPPGRIAPSAARAFWDPASGASAPVPASMPVSAWRRVEVVPGVELHVSGSRPLPSPEGLRELAEWCERNLRV
jgi:DNA-binding transcriptional MerR regulator